MSITLGDSLWFFYFDVNGFEATKIKVVSIVNSLNAMDEVYGFFREQETMRLKYELDLETGIYHHHYHHHYYHYHHHHHPLAPRESRYSSQVN